MMPRYILIEVNVRDEDYGKPGVSSGEFGTV
jgi:hypothetical protein